MPYKSNTREVSQNETQKGQIMLTNDEINKPGRYDKECSEARKACGADAVLLIVHNGREGHGFSVESTDLDIVDAIPRVLRMVADQIENGIKAQKN